MDRLINNRFAGKDVEVLTAARILSEADAGKTFYLNLATGFTITLPRMLDTGSSFPLKFVVKTAPASGTYVITENTQFDTNTVIVNGISELDVDTGNNGPYSTGCTTITFADGVAVAGDWILLNRDGTKWYCTGQTNADGGITIA